MDGSVASLKRDLLAKINRLRSMSESQKLDRQGMLKVGHNTVELTYTADMRRAVYEFTRATSLGLSRVTYQGKVLRFGEAFLIETLQVRCRSVVENVAVSHVGSGKSALESLYMTPEHYDATVAKAVAKARLNGVILSDSGRKDNGETFTVTYTLRAGRMFSDAEFLEAAKLAF